LFYALDNQQPLFEKAHCHGTNGKTNGEKLTKLLLLRIAREIASNLVT